MRSIDNYIDAANQYNWWDWGTILSNLEDLIEGKSIVIDAPYQRDTGEKSDALILTATNNLIYEGAIFGPPFIVTKLKRIFFLWVPPKIRLQRLIEKDLGRRSFNEILARFLITEYSETSYYINLFNWAEEKIIFIDGLSGMPCNKPKISGHNFIPLRINISKNI
ncbi:hypothetical protein BEN30_13550 [Magnetovibrio blakemorei]|uniref:Uncharacterized protein n=2 Tax=Magnetovibrio blakemorei TaxID=28181 RepID=A0A1E5Q5Y7_9PROT|nr:hypothetical protein BEN30_13550 [Magnetovibrio blakemorei]